MLPIIGLVLVDVFVWGPAGEAPGKIDQALQEKLTAPLLDAGAQVAEGFGVDSMPAAAFLSDLWIFDGNLGVAVVALLGYTPTEVRNVTYDVAYLETDHRHPNRRRP